MEHNDKHSNNSHVQVAGNERMELEKNNTAYTLMSKNKNSDKIPPGFNCYSMSNLSMQTKRCMGPTIMSRKGYNISIV